MFRTGPAGGPSAARAACGGHPEALGLVERAQLCDAEALLRWGDPRLVQLLGGSVLLNFAHLCNIKNILNVTRNLFNFPPKKRKKNFK